MNLSLVRNFLAAQMEGDEVLHDVDTCGKQT